MMAKDFSLIDVKIMRNSKDPEQVYESLTRIFNHLDSTKRGSIGIKQLKKFCS